VLRPEDLDRSWFQSLLSQRYPATEVTGVDITRVHEWTNLHVRIDLSYDNAGGAPDKVFVKLPPGDERKAKALGSARMGAREARFYNLVAPDLDLRVPIGHGSVIEDDGGFAVVIEDLAATGCRTYNTVGIDRDAAARAFEDLAAMHVRFEDPASRRADTVSWIKAPPIPPPATPEPPNYGQKLLRFGIDAHRDLLSDAYVAVAERWIAHGTDLQRRWWDAPLTVIHGDPHPGNLFDDRGRVGFLDWGLVCLGDPLRDISYFLCISLDVDVRRASEEELIRHYLDVRRALGGAEIGFDHAWARHRLHAAYVVPASCQCLDLAAAKTDSARRFSETFLTRAVAAVDDLETNEVIAAR
jgi:hypothetical protein